MQQNIRKPIIRGWQGFVSIRSDASATIAETDRYIEIKDEELITLTDTSSGNRNNQTMNQ